MKVLWFANGPALGEAKINIKTTSGGWLKSMNKVLQDKIDLHIAFYDLRATDDYTFEKTHYYPIKRGPILLEILKRRFLKFEADEEDLDIYLSIINKIKPDIIHIHGTENPFGCVVGKTKIPVVVSIQGNITVIKHLFFRGIERKYLNISNLSFASIPSFLFNENFKSYLEHFSKKQLREEKNFRKVKYIIGRTAWDRRIASIQAPVGIYFHNDEIMRDRFYELIWQYNETISLLIHSTISDSFFKGLETVCMALQLLNELGYKTIWNIAGIAETDLIVKVVKRKLGKNYPNKGLCYLGAINENILVTQMLGANMYVMPSHIENAGNALSEAMLLGMPCIAAFSGGTATTITDGIEGIMVQDGEPWALAGAILEIYKNPIQAKEYGTRARTKGILRHSKEKIVSELLDIYSDIIKMESKINNVAIESNEYLKNPLK